MNFKLKCGVHLCPTTHLYHILKQIHINSIELMMERTWPLHRIMALSLFLSLLWETFIILQTAILCCLTIFFNYFFNISIAITSLFPQIRNRNPPFHCTSKSFFPHSRRKFSLWEEISPVKQDSALKRTGCRIVDNQIFITTTDRDSTTILWSLFQSLTTLVIKTSFPVVQMDCPKLKFVPLGSSH